MPESFPMLFSQGPQSMNKNVISICTTPRRSHRILYSRLLTCLTHPGPGLLNPFSYFDTHKRHRTTLHTEQNINIEALLKVLQEWWEVPNEGPFGHCKGSEQFPEEGLLSIPREEAETLTGSWVPSQLKQDPTPHSWDWNWWRGERKPGRAGTRYLNGYPFSFLNGCREKDIND